MTGVIRNAAESSAPAVQLSFPLPKAPETKVHIHLTINQTFLLLFLTTSEEGRTSAVSLGSFVYALPDVGSHRSKSCCISCFALTCCKRLNAGQTISTALCSVEATVEFATRLAKLLARRTGKPVYVGNSVSFASAGWGGSVEEEMEGFKKSVEVVMDEVRKQGGMPFVNGVSS